MKLKQRRINWLKKVLSKTVEDRQKSRWKKLMQRMSRINAKWVKTYRGQVWIQRNEPCPCGNTYEGTVWRETKGPHKGRLILDEKGKPQERPVKFKHCCWSKYAVKTEETKK
jgi:hypothetical protein